jgi:hypothetical protein
MFERLRNGWRLACESLAVIRSDKKLLIFPLLSGLACVLVMLSFLLPLLLVQDQINNRDIPPVAAFIYVFAFYFVSYFVIIFFNSALVSCAIIRFNGGEPTLGDGLRAAGSRLPQILGWALVSATVGMILKLIENANDKVGKFVAGLLGMAWNAITFFVVPVLVVEKLGPINAFKRSASLVRQTWGESLTANFSISLIMILWFLLAAIPLIIGLLMQNWTAAMIGLSVSVVLWLVIGLVSAAAHVVLTSVLYQFAAQKPLPTQFDREMLEGAFKRK